MIASGTSTAESVPAISGIKRERLFKGGDAATASISIERIALAPGTTLRLEVSNESAAWLHILDGSVTLKAFEIDRLDNRHSAFLPPGFKASLTCEKMASLLYAEVPDVARVNDGQLHRPLFIVTEWAREEAFVCEQNKRKRVPLVSPPMCDTTALKVDMVIYPPDSAAPECFHEGAGTFMYFLTGRGSGTANGTVYSAGTGQLIYFADRERHMLQAAGDELRFIEIHVPAEFKTVWTDPKKVSVWRSTGLDISGFETALDKKTRQAFRFVFPLGPGG